MSDSEISSKALLEIWGSAIDAVSGYQAVANAIRSDSHFEPDQVIAVGKAAVGMCLGALDNLPSCAALVVTKYEHTDEAIRNRDGVAVIEAAHPIPDQNSLRAGSALLERIKSMSEGSRLLLLVSGGASALAEALPDNMALDDLQSMTDELIAGGHTIGQINARRKQASLIKDGKLVENFAGVEIRVYAISDVEGDGIETIGSGIGDCHRSNSRASSSIIASNQIARERAASKARELGYEVKKNQESLYGDVFELAPVIGRELNCAAPGVYIWGGEPTVVLPPNPGSGGRNQSLALAISEYISGTSNISLLVAGTDGSDGPTTAAGGLVDGKTWHSAASTALQQADAGAFLKQQGNLFVTGPTNTNVMDLAIAVVD